MIENPIVDEVHRIREQMLAEYNGDIVALLKDAQRGTEERRAAGRQVASLPTKLPMQEQPPPTKKAG
jgi:hypothetical protein